MISVRPVVLVFFDTFVLQLLRDLCLVVEGNDHSENIDLFLDALGKVEELL